MPRPREFDEGAALDAAVQCFWARGYEATSVRDLAACMGISGTSLYNAFGDKQALFRRALDRYLDGSVRARISRLESSLAPRDAIEGFIREVLERSVTDRQRRGCMLVNSALEVAPHDPEIRALVAGELAEIEAFFARSVRAGQTLGSISPSPDAGDMARMLLGLLLGLRVLARSRPDRALLEGAARPVLALLAPPAAKARPGAARTSGGAGKTSRRR